MRKMILLIIAISLTGCALFTEKVYIEKPVPYVRVPLGVTPPHPIVLKNVNVVLVQPENGKPYFKLTPESYRNIIINNKQIENYIREANSRIIMCEDYYTQPIEEQE